MISTDTKHEIIRRYFRENDCERSLPGIHKLIARP